MAMTDEEMFKKLEELKAQNLNGEPIELSSLRKFLIDGIKDQNVVTGFKLKMLFGIAFGIPQETLEMQQLHELQLAYDKKFAEVKQEQKVIRYIIIAVGAVLGVPEVIRLFGFG